MSWSINEVVRLSGVTSRTLRHYDAIGLLKPESTEFGGRRMYGHADLLRLQEILVLRDLGLPLKAIGEVLDTSRAGEDRTTILEGHLEWLKRERTRLDRLIGTVETTIREGDEMNAERMFEGFAANPYEAEARRRWGDRAIDDSNERLKNLSPREIERLRSGFPEVHERVAALLAEGAGPGEERVQAVVRQHHELVSLAWEPSREAYIGLGRMYVEDDRFREAIGEGDDRLVEFLRDAMVVYAERELV